MYTPRPPIGTEYYIRFEKIRRFFNVSQNNCREIGTQILYLCHGEPGVKMLIKWTQEVREIAVYDIVLYREQTYIVSYMLYEHCPPRRYYIGTAAS